MNRYGRVAQKILLSRRKMFAHKRVTVDDDTPMFMCLFIRHIDCIGNR